MTASRVGAVLALVALSGLAPAARPFRSPSGPAVAAATTVLVMPFERTGGDLSSGWLGEGLALIVTETLRTLEVDVLTRDERVAAFERLDLPSGIALSRATIFRAADMAGVGHVVVGSFAVAGDRLTARARVIDVEAARQGPDVEETASLADLFGVGERLAHRLDLGDRTRRAAVADGAPRPPSLEAFEFYVKGVVAETAASQRRFLERALELAPTYARARLALWRVLSEQGAHGDALAVVRGVTPTAPEAREARFRGALSLVELGRLDEAASAFEALAAERPGAAVWNNLGVIAVRRGGAAADRSPAVFFARAAELEPGEPDYAFNLGYACAGQHDWARARDWLREAVRLDPADADAHFLLGVALEALGARTEGLRERELAARLSSRYETAGRDGRLPGVPRGLERLARDLEPSRLRSLRQAMLGARAREHEELARFYVDRARRLIEGRDERGAIRELRRAVYLSPYLAEAHVLLGQAYLRTGQAREAVDALTIAVWIEESFRVRLALARAHLQAGDVAAARAEVGRVLQHEPESAEARALLAEIDRAAAGGPGRSGGRP